MKKYKGGGILTLLLEIIGLVVIVGGVYIYLRLNTDIFDGTSVIKNNSASTSMDVANAIPNGKCGLTVTSHLPNSKTGFPLIIKGVVDNTDSKDLGCVWQMFEGQAGTVQLYFKDNDEWKKLGSPTLIPVENWMSNKTFFSVGLDFNNEGIGLPTGTFLKVIFTEENASGITPVDTYELPLILDSNLNGEGAGEGVNSTSSKLMSLTLYIQNKEIARTSDCGVTQPVVYQVPKTLAVADASLKILFASGIGELSKYGIYKSVSISNGIAKVMLASELTPEGRPIGGLSSCESSHLMSVSRDTLTQYKNIKSVEIYSPKGKIEF
jgi:hypothetical protein